MINKNETLKGVKMKKAMKQQISTQTEIKLDSIIRMIRKRKADVSLTTVYPSKRKIIVTCRIKDLDGNMGQAVISSEEVKDKSDDSQSLKDRICCQALDDAFTDYISLINQQVQAVYKDNNLRSTSDTIDLIDKAVKDVFAKSKAGNQYTTNLHFGVRERLQIEISTNEPEKMDVIIYTHDGAEVFSAYALPTKGFDEEGYVRWIYAAFENCILNHAMRKELLLI